MVDFQVGDFIKYTYATEVYPGRILKILPQNKYKIEFSLDSCKTTKSETMIAQVDKSEIKKENIIM